VHLRAARFSGTSPPPPPPARPRWYVRFLLFAIIADTTLFCFSIAQFHYSGLRLTGRRPGGACVLLIINAVEFISGESGQKHDGLTVSAGPVGRIGGKKERNEKTKYRRNNTVHDNIKHVSASF